MNPTELGFLLKQSYVSYLLANYSFNKEFVEINNRLQQRYAQHGSLIKGPFLEATPPFKLSETSIQGMVDEGVLCEEFTVLFEGQPAETTAKNAAPTLFGDRPSHVQRVAAEKFPPERLLYSHQDEAIRRLCTAALDSPDTAHTIVASGTGSGKTECFLVPAIDWVLRHPTKPVDERAPGTGIRVILVYPMNALVNDQIRRLSGLVGYWEENEDPQLPITFARYTGETEKSNRRKAQEKEPGAPTNQLLTREEIWETPPDILITNFAMLEQALLRPEESPFFDKVDEHAWRYIILDEAHSYRGAQAIDLARLMQRVKSAVKRGKQDGGVPYHAPICVATSATLSDPKAPVEEQKKVTAEFGNAIFQAPFTGQSVILAERIPPDTQDCWEYPGGADMEADMEAGWADVEFPTLELASPVDDAFLKRFEKVIPADITAQARQACGQDRRLFLYHVLNRHPRFKWLWSQIEEAPRPFDELAACWTDGADGDQDMMLANFIECCNAARRNDTDQPLLPCRYHLFASALEGVFVELASNEEIKQAIPGLVVPEMGIKQLSTRRIASQDRDTFEMCYCRVCNYPMVVHDPTPEEDFSMDQAPVWRRNVDFYGFSPENNYGDPLQEKTIHLNAHCKDAGTETIPRTLYEIPKYRSKDSEEGYDIQCCPNCGRNRTHHRQVVRRLSTGQDIPVSILTTSLYGALPKSRPTEDWVSTNIDDDKIIGDGRKLLVFNDSRQNAAYLASFIQRRSTEDVLRNSAYQVLKASTDQVKFKDWAADLASYLEDKSIWSPFLKERDITEITDEGPYSKSYHQLGRDKDNTCKSFLINELLNESSRFPLEGLGIVGYEYELPKQLHREGDSPEGHFPLSQPLPYTELRQLYQRILKLVRRIQAIEITAGIQLDRPANDTARLWLQKPKSADSFQIGFLSSRGNVFTDLLSRWLKSRGENEHDDPGKLAGLGEKLFEIFRTDKFKVAMEGQQCYQLKPDNFSVSLPETLYQCDYCGRYETTHLQGICSTPYCAGMLVEVPVNLHPSKNPGQNFFVRQNTKEGLADLRCEEHTAQLSSELAQQTQLAFQRGQVNILCCSTTFEMGIDIGALQAIVLRNVPPGTTNYVQRAGRAGRRADAVAFVLTFCQRRAHDQHFFADPVSIISGKVTPPKIDLDNRTILYRHCFAEILSEYLQWLNKEQVDGKEGVFSNSGRLRFFFEDEIDGLSQTPFMYFAEWLNGEDNRRRCKGRLQEAFDMTAEDAEDYLSKHMRAPEFSQEPLVRAWEYYDGVVRSYEEEKTLHESNVQTLRQKRDAAETQAEKEQFEKDIAKENRYTGMYSGLARQIRNELVNQFLTRHTALPSFTFPVNVAQLHILAQEKNPNRHRQHLFSFDRDMKIALSEYAPGSQVVAGKRIYEPVGIRKYPVQELDGTNWYRWCRACNGIQESRSGDGGDFKSPSCPFCGAEFRPGHINPQQWVEPKWGFVTDVKDKGKRITGGRPQRLTTTRSFFMPKTAIDPKSLDEREETDCFPNELSNTRVETRFSSGSNLLVLNLGDIDNISEGATYRRGFKICSRCGLVKNNAQKNTAHKPPFHMDGRTCTGPFVIGESKRMEVALGHKYQTDVLELRFRNTGKELSDNSFWTSLAYGVAHAAAIELNIERNDLDVTIYPVQGENEYAVVVYDSVPGGAGHAHQIVKSLPAVLRRTRELLAGCNCDPESTGCYGCLADYKNQFVHGQLSRGIVLPYLESLVDALDEDDSSIWRNPTSNPTRQIASSVLSHHGSTTFYVNDIQPGAIVGLDRDWFDVIKTLALRGERGSDVIVNVAAGKIDGLSADNIASLRLAELIGLGVKVTSGSVENQEHNVVVISSPEETVVWKWPWKDGLGPDLKSATRSKMKKGKEAFDELTVEDGGEGLSFDETKAGFQHFRLEPSGNWINPFGSQYLAEIAAYKTIKQILIIDPFILSGEREVKGLAKFLRGLKECLDPRCEIKIASGNVQSRKQDRNSYNFHSAQKQRDFTIEAVNDAVGITPLVKIPGKGNFPEHDRLILTNGIWSDGEEVQYQALLGQGIFGFSEFCRKRSEGVVFRTDQGKFKGYWNKF